jgi:hypothetical protein
LFAIAVSFPEKHIGGIISRRYEKFQYPPENFCAPETVMFPRVFTMMETKKICRNDKRQSTGHTIK